MEESVLSQAECLLLIQEARTATHRAALNQLLTKILCDLPPDSRLMLAMAMKQWYRHQLEIENPSQDAIREIERVRRVVGWLLYDKLPFTYLQIMELLADIQFPPRPEVESWGTGAYEMMYVLNYYLEDNALTPPLAESIEKAYAVLKQQQRNQGEYALGPYILTAKGIEILAIGSGESWSELAYEQISALPLERRALWINLVEQCRRVPNGKPTKKWLKAAQAARQALGIEPLNRALIDWFSRVGEKPSNTQRQTLGARYGIHSVLQGFVWLCAGQADADLVRAVGALAIASFHKEPKREPNKGPRSAKLGNICIKVLAMMPTPEAMGQLALLKAKVRSIPTQKEIEKALIVVAQREGFSREEIEEISVPTYGLTEVGSRLEALGDYKAELTIIGNNSVALRWIRPDGKVQKSVPNAVRKENVEANAEAIKALKKAVKDIKKVLPAQRDRLESLYLQQKSWDFATWRSRYLNHVLIGPLARRLIWQFESPQSEKEPLQATGIWQSGQLVDAEEQPISWLSETTQVSLWHPITASSERVQRWRSYLWKTQVQQPFKQAHREIYWVAPAEDSTRTYSNRFAAHVLKQHQLKALCDRRGWRYSLQLAIDCSDQPAILYLPKWNIRVDFKVKGVGDDDDYMNDSTDAGAFFYVATDQVRFRTLEPKQSAIAPPTAKLIDLSAVPPLVFTEAMRDIDLFIGVASIGSDPNWIDSATKAHHRSYWQRYAFGELSAAAQTRRQVLKVLIPKLKICCRCTFQGNFLIVKGDIRTYKIHLGSGNILMEPNDQYLCIVGSCKDSAGQIFLPFEGDKTLALILSKAFLLSDDANIEDRTITRQIHLEQLEHA
ncbi:MAG: DUF4132 domain-containing protein [Phormidesmis sp.]